jgi:hypothetical protein
MKLLSVLRCLVYGTIATLIAVGFVYFLCMLFCAMRCH